MSVTEFVPDPTFGSLVRLAERAAAPVAAVPLHPGGAGTPLFLAADAAGNGLSYRHLADLLGAERPVYVLEPIEADYDRIMTALVAHFP